MTNEQYAPLDYTASFDDSSISMGEEANRGLEIFKSRPIEIESDTERFEICKSRRLESDSERFTPSKRRAEFGSEYESSPPISPSPSFGTATTVSMDHSMTSTQATEPVSHQSNHHPGEIITSNNSGDNTPCNIITFLTLYPVEEEDKESSVGSLFLSNPLSESESKSIQDLYQSPSSSLYPTQEDKDELNRRFKLTHQRCHTPANVLVQ